jgi:hypothetical protein
MICSSVKPLLPGFRALGSQFKLVSYNGGSIIKMFNEGIKIGFLQ